MDDISSDPNLDTLTATMNTGAVSLPTDVTWTAATKVLAYGGGGAVGTTSGHIITLDDGTDTTDSDPFDIPITNWPINGFAVQGSYAITNQDQQLGTEPYRTDNGETDIVIYQWRYQDATRQATEKTYLDWFAANHPYCNLCMYFVLDIKKSSIFDARWQTSQLITGGNGHDSWFLHNSSGAQVEAKFDAALL